MDDTSSAPPFEEHLSTTIQTIRGTLSELLLAAGADPAKPQVVAREFGINRNLAWKVSRIINATDPAECVPHLPGAAGAELVLAAMQKHGAGAALVGNARSALAAFDDMVEVHAGDRATLDRMLSGLAAGTAGGEGLEHSRKLAFEGNAGTWGVQARTQFGAMILAPNADDSTLVDLVQIAGLVRFRRLRADARWLLFRSETFADAGSTVADTAGDAIDARFAGPERMPLMADFCSKPIPTIEVVRRASETQYELPAGPVGNTAAMTLVYGTVSRGFGSAYGDNGDEHADLGSGLITPVEHFQLDVLVHDDVPWAAPRDVVMYGRLDGGPIEAELRQARNFVPFSERIQSLGRGIPATSTQHVPDYANVLRAAFDHVQWDPASFRGHRFAMKYPPLPCSALMRWPLAER